MILFYYSIFLNLEFRNLGHDINYSLVGINFLSQVEKPAKLNSSYHLLHWPTDLISWYLTILPAKRAEEFDILPVYNPCHN